MNNTRLLPLPTVQRNQKNSSFIDKLAKRGFLARMANIIQGEVVIQDGDEIKCFGQVTESLSGSVVITVNDPQFYSDIAFGGSVGAGESYFQGRWECNDLTSLVRIMLVNRSVLDDMDSTFSRVREPLYRALHWLNRNTKKGSRKNIEAHYDLGNELFKLFLDKNMMYSCAVYEQSHYDLEQASYAKLERICHKLELKASDHVVEIGTGWGGFAIHAAQHYGCHVTTTTISSEQYAYAMQRVTEAGLTDKITVLCKDYRELEGCYDKLVSIEMIEAIGHQYLPTYFRQCSHLLKPDGMMLLQAITIVDQRYKSALRSSDFIKQYIFPGSFIPSVSAMVDTTTNYTDMRLFHLEDIGPHYATTLKHWRERFLEKLDDVRALGYPEAFIRMWEFYLCYCEGGFKEQVIGNVHMLLVKPECRKEPLLSPLQNS